jgi:hypothetical protein
VIAGDGDFADTLLEECVGENAIRLDFERYSAYLEDLSDGGANSVDSCWLIPDGNSGVVH